MNDVPYALPPIVRGEETVIRAGYCPGVIGRMTELHMRFYSSHAGFGQFFESKVATGLAEFCSRLQNSRNGLWTAQRHGDIAGGIAIDSEDLGGGVAHLRWFIVSESMQGAGLGRRLLSEAMGFCERRGFPEVHLWTFSELGAARRLYGLCGFELAEEVAGTQWGTTVMEQRFVCSLPARHSKHGVSG